MSIALLIADDHELIRAGLRATFARTGIVVVGEAATGEEALRLAGDALVDVVLLDISWARGEIAISDQGFDLLSQIRFTRPRLPILMYSLHDSASYIQRCRLLGANGYLCKGVDDSRLTAAVRAVFAGREVWPDQLRRRGVSVTRRRHEHYRRP
jgi:two-component system response regulator NreC